MHYEMFLNKLFFDVFFIKKPRHRLAIAIFGNTLPIMAPKSTLAPRLSRPIRVPQPPYSSMWCPYVTPKRRLRPLAAIVCVENHIVFVIRGFGKISIEKSWCHPSSIMAMERPNGAPGAHPRDQYRFPCAHIRLWGTLGCIKAERREKSIGGFIRDEMMIAMGDMPWIYKKLHLVPGDWWQRPVGADKKVAGKNNFGGKKVSKKRCRHLFEK